MLTRKKILLSVLLFAAAVRGIFACMFSNSMFRSYHLVPGLDMQTLLRFAEWGTPQAVFPPFFSPHRLLLYVNWFCHGGKHETGWIFAVQALLGILASLVIADLTLSLTGKKRGALVAGMVSAACLPFLVYEFSVLQDSMAVYLTLFAAWGSAKALRYRFALKWAVISGVLWSFALSGRPAALLFAGAAGVWGAYRMYRLGKYRRFVVFLLTLAVMLGTYSSFNKFQGWDFSPFYPVMGYAKTFNSVPGDAPASEYTVLFNAVRRVPWLFAAYERMENQNIYFWCEKLPLLHILPAPGIVVPAAAAAFLILLAAGYWKKERFWYIAVPVLTLALPLCTRDVIGRYRLMLVPYFIIAPVMAFYAYRNLPVRRKYFALFMGGLAAAVSVYCGLSMPRNRAADLHAWALAMQNTPGAAKTEVIAAYLDYWDAAPASPQAFISAMSCLFRYNELSTAERLLPVAQKYGISGDLTGYFYMWIAVLRNDPVSVSRICASINPDNLPAEQQKIFLRVRSDTIRMLHKQKK
ncbi:MAG: glycosyltransferase family 39 protein [Lentisphaeria bacterium]|nr:glycosyltransferase family 39 protein [Lentisphaeria bacterium]